MEGRMDVDSLTFEIVALGEVLVFGVCQEIVTIPA